MLKGPATSRGPCLSKTWEVVKTHRGAYSGGKVQLSADGTTLGCLYEANVTFLDVDSGEVTRKLKDEDSAEAEEEIVCFTLHPIRAEIVTASRNLLLRHWDLATGECRRSIKAHGLQVLCMDYDSTGTLVGTGSADRMVKVFDVEGGYCTHSFRGHTAIITLLTFHPDPKQLLLVSASEDSTLRVWDLRKQVCMGVLEAHLSLVTSAAFLGGGDIMVSGGRDRVLNVWDLKRSKLLKTVPVYEEVEGLQTLLPKPGCFSAAPKPSPGTESMLEGLIAVAGQRGVVRVFKLGPAKVGYLCSQSNTKSAKSKLSSSRLSCTCVMTQDNVKALHRAGYTALLSDPRRGGLVAVTADHNFMLLGIGPGGKGLGDDSVSEGVLSTERQIVGYNDEVIDIKHLPTPLPSSWQPTGRVGGGAGLEPGGCSWVAVATNSPQVRLFELGGFSCRLLDGHTETVLSLDVAPDGRHLCTSSKDRVCLLWDIELGIPVVRWVGHTDAIGAVASSKRPGPWISASDQAFVVTGAADRTLKRWDVPLKALSSLEAEARGSRLLLNFETKAGAGAGAGAESGRVGGGGEGKEWVPPEPLAGTARQSVRAHEKDVNGLAVSPNDGLIASASQDRTVKLWQAGDLTLAGVLKGHKRGVWKVEFSPVDRCLASCSGDRTVKLWSVTDFSCLRTFQV
ncbi:unnamed protein product [Discosporangium mesarthrocarpum]